MPKSPFRRKPSAHGASSFLRFLFPHTRQRARAHLSKFRHETLPSLKHRTQARIYKYIVYRQALKLKGKPGFVQRFRGHTRKLLGPSQLENDVRLRRQRLTKDTDAIDPRKAAMSYQDYDATREGGGRRKKLAGYLKAANDLRQTYQQQYAPGWSRREAAFDYDDDTPGNFPDAAVVRNGTEEMILFPSYARTHIKRTPEAVPGTIQETPGDGRDVRDSAGAGDAEFWKQQWENYEDDKAVVDVDVRGWIYSPFKGQMSRKQRLFIGLARQLVGIQAPPAGAQSSSSTGSPISSREPSPGQTSHHERAQARQAQRDDVLATKEAEEILRRGEREAAAAAKGAYSERPAADITDDIELYRAQSRDSVRSTDSRGHLGPRKASYTPSESSIKDEENITPIKRRATWNQPADMSPSELAEANTRLMTRLRHFLAIPMANTPISIFFYNDKISRQRTVNTNPSGHFSITAALDFVPTHIRVLASDKLSATEEIIITESRGVSVISDIDDTIKHSAISSGAREIFRNAFIRELGDLTIEGVKEWYNEMAQMGVKFHYVSNSPWQLYPVISAYFSLAGLPPGSFHLKQYSGMLQGIFEPVAERKKATLDKIARDFPERRFILIGDSGEADLEVYTDFVLENPTRVVAVFIRDVTTTDSGGFFDSSMGPMSGDTSSSPSHRGTRPSTGSVAKTSSGGEEDDPELRAAIEASLRHADEQGLRRSKSIFPQIEDDHPGTRPGLPLRKASEPAPSQPVQNLIDLSSDDEPDELPVLRHVTTDTQAQREQHRASVASTISTKSAPPPPRKPMALRSSSGDSLSSSAKGPAPPPPKPRNPSSALRQPSAQSQPTSSPSNTKASVRPPVAPKPNLQSQQSYAGIAREKLSSVYNNLPSASSYVHTNQPSHSDNEPSQTSSGGSAARKPAPPPPPPPRRAIAAYPVAAASYVGTKANAAWQHAPAIPHPSTRPGANASPTGNAQPFSTNPQRQHPQRTNTSSTLGLNGGAGANGYGDGNGYPQGTKREIMWRQRWARAEHILGERGVVLRSWREGRDVSAEAERVIREVEKNDKDRS
ncbi:hypothetical protein BDV95DRAFT_368643 [Massariosphaeria phaeospora]|uniref:Phosphatidate phosphatase APP1 catalytic domain-containing protein n=1 Tax=Massariosphaeria phaeospora TaxID=100035 RepID=A0A7C8M7U0_9PLEO|nr:hypothetical protein BDV95DRAFT_368643 [Massariosphaeria phaeospora]